MILLGFASAANGMQALINQNDSTANNIANVNTIGFKRQRLTFKNIYDTSIQEKANDGSDNVRNIGNLSIGSQVEKLTYDFTQGVLSKTGNPFDFAIEGDGFFKVQSPQGQISYTRNGSFTMDNKAFLVTKDGDYVLDDKGKRIKIDTQGLKMHSRNDIFVTEDGQIEINNEHNPTMLQKIGIYDFANKDDLQEVASTKYKPTDATVNKEVRPTKFKIEQGTLELSNSNVVNEMISTINTSRNYESLAQSIKTGSETLAEALKVGRLS